MKIGSKITMRGQLGFFRFYVTRISGFIQLYDPVNNFSWGFDNPNVTLNRVIDMPSAVSDYLCGKSKGFY